MTAVRCMISILCIAWGLTVALPLSAEDGGVVHFPQEIQRSCRGGRAQMYDECGSQADILRAAEKAADVQGKTVLVVFGAEWCIWCHVLEKHLQGEADRFHYNVEGDKYALFERDTGASDVTPSQLNAYARDTLVLAHIESQHSPDGDAILIETGARKFFENALPFVFAVKDGRFVAAMASTDDLIGLEVRRDTNDWYRGYNRSLLLAELTRLVEAANSR